MSRFGHPRRFVSLRPRKPPPHAVERASRIHIRNFLRGSASFSPAVGPRHRSVANPTSASHSFFWTIRRRSRRPFFSPCRRKPRLINDRNASRRRGNEWGPKSVRHHGGQRRKNDATPAYLLA